ncbi:hypothetical protein VUR80DRAFT_5738 [Thermomyces stellatus]
MCLETDSPDDRRSERHRKNKPGVVIARPKERYFLWSLGNATGWMSSLRLHQTSAAGFRRQSPGHASAFPSELHHVSEGSLWSGSIWRKNGEYEGRELATQFRNVSSQAWVFHTTHLLSCFFSRPVIKSSFLSFSPCPLLLFQFARTGETWVGLLVLAFFASVCFTRRQWGCSCSFSFFR